MAEASDLEGAFEDFWRWFEFDFWRSLPHMRLHCQKVIDDRFPEWFLDQFVTKVEGVKWSIYDDPHGEVPKKIMDDMIKSLKGFYDVPQCEEVPKEEIMDVEELEQIEENIDMDGEELTPEQQIERNREKMKKRFDKYATSRSVKRAAVNAKAKADRESRKDEKQLQQAENLGKNCLKKKKK